MLAGLRSRRAVSRIEVVLAVPAGSRRAWSQGQFLAAAAAEPRLQDVRADFRGHLLEWIRIYARYGSWLHGEADPRATARPGRALVCQLGGMCPSTSKACRRWWEAAGYVAVVRQGRTEDARKMTKRRDVESYDGNDAQVLVLCIPLRNRAKRPSREPAPAVPKLTRPPQEVVGNVVAHTRGPVENPGDDQDPGRTALRAGSPPPVTPRPVLTPRQLAGHRVLQRLSDKAVRAAWRPFQAAGWSTPDWLYAINWRPDGRAHRKDLGDVRRPAGWLRWRLSFWLGADGKPRPSRSQRAAARALLEERRRAEDRGRAGIARLRPPPDLRPQAG